MAQGEAGIGSGGSSKTVFWVGWVLSAIPALMLISGGIFAWMRSPQVVQGTSREGWDPSLLPLLGSIEIACAVLFLMPHTAVFGALLMTAYLGGAVAMHLRLGETQWFVPIIFGIVVWTAMLLREPRLRALLPFRSA